MIIVAIMADALIIQLDTLVGNVGGRAHELNS
jgi:hypothetical protein